MSATHKINADVEIQGNITSTSGGPKLILTDSTDDDDQQILFKNSSGTVDYRIHTSDFTGAGGGDGMYIGSTQSDGEVCLVTHDTIALTLDTSQNATFAGGVTATTGTFSGNITANGNIIGDDGTNITNINSIESDSFAADADNTTKISMSATGMDVLIADTDVFQVAETSFTFSVNTVNIPQDIVHSGDTNNKITFGTDTQTFTTGGAARLTLTDSLTTLNSGGNDAMKIYSNATSNQPLVEILGAGAGNQLNIGLLLKGTVNGNPVKMKMQAPNDSASVTGAGILSYEPDADEFNIGQSTTHNDMAISIDNSENVTIDKRKFTKTSTTDGDHSGDVVYFGGTTSMTTGAIYHYKSDGTWELADADAAANCDGLLGVALGSASDTNGVLLRGMVTLDHDPGAVGDVLFLSTTAGDCSATAPSGNGDIVRVVGYCLDASNGQIYFSPDGTFVEVTA